MRGKQNKMRLKIKKNVTQFNHDNGNDEGNSTKVKVITITLSDKKTLIICKMIVQLMVSHSTHLHMQSTCNQLDQPSLYQLEP